MALPNINVKLRFDFSALNRILPTAELAMRRLSIALRQPLAGPVPTVTPNPNPRAPWED